MRHLIKILFILFCSIANAAMMNIPDTTGLHPSDIGSARAFSLFSENYSSVYYNPAGLSLNSENALSLGYVYTKPQLTLGGDVAFSQPNEFGLLGVKISLSNLLTSDRALALGILLGVDRNFTGLLQINDGISDTGQFIRYGRGQMLLITSLGLEPYRGIYVGGGAYITVRSTASVLFNTTLSGTTSDESLELKGKTGISPIAGIIIKPLKIAGSKKVDFLKVALAYRGKSEYTVGIKTDVNATIGGSPLTTLPLDLIFLDAFVPQQLSIGIKIIPLTDIQGLSVGLQTNYAFWNELDDIMKEKDSVRDELNLDFKNVFNTSVGVEYNGNELYVIRAGYGYEPSPLVSTSSGKANLVDSTRHIIGMGAGYTFKRVPGFKNPLSVDAAYQLHLLSKRTFELERSDGNTQSVESGGYMNTFNLSLTLRF